MPKHPPRRPKWVTWNKVLVALHLMGDNAGRVVATRAEIASAARLGWRAIESALQVLEVMGHLRVVDPCVVPWTIKLDLPDIANSPGPVPPAPREKPPRAAGRKPRRAAESGGASLARSLGRKPPRSRRPQADQLVFAWYGQA